MSFGDDLPVWGGNSWHCRSLISNAIEEVGPKRYLLVMKESFELGYNHADMQPLSSDELIEFRNASINWFRRNLHGHIENDGLSKLFDQFVDLVGRRLANLERN